MIEPMLTVSAERADSGQVQINLLPCKTHYNGTVEPVESYWKPVESQDGSKKIAHFRGRKLFGKTMKLPPGYYGAVVEKGQTKAEIPREHELSEDDEVQEIPEPINVAPMEGKAHFDSIVVWGHESTADSATDPFVRSMEEWVTFAEQIHSYPAESKTTN